MPGPASPRMTVKPRHRTSCSTALRIASTCSFARGSPEPTRDRGRSRPGLGGACRCSAKPRQSQSPSGSDLADLEFGRHAQGTKRPGELIHADARSDFLLGTPSSDPGVLLAS